MHLATALLLVAANSSAAAAVDDAVPELRAFIPDEAARSQVAAFLEHELARAFPDDAKLRARVTEEIAKNLAAKIALPPVAGKSFALSAGEIEREVIGYEIFKMKTFLSSGVFPKRYFGYFDERWDTAARERELRETVRCAVDVINAKAIAQTHVSDIEVAVTFIAEGGAILLRENQASLDDIHPVLDVGLDDIATGLARDPALVKAIDLKCGTDVAGVVGHDKDGAPVLARKMKFREGIVGTALMFEYEKSLARTKLAAEGVDIAKLPLDDQYVAASLVYNSGLLFSASSRAHIAQLATGAELNAVSVKNAKTRWPLPVSSPDQAAARMRAGEDYPVQPTSWSGMYHVLQRYGGYRALRLFTDVFDDAGMYRAP